MTLDEINRKHGITTKSTPKAQTSASKGGRMSLEEINQAHGVGTTKSNYQKWLEQTSELFNNAANYFNTNKSSAPIIKQAELEKDKQTVQGYDRIINQYYAGGGIGGGVGMQRYQAAEQAKQDKKKNLEDKGYKSDRELIDAIKKVEGTGVYDRDFGSSYTDKLAEAKKQGEKLLKELEGTSDYDQLKGYLDEIQGLTDAFGSIRDYYGQWASKSDYENGLGFGRTFGQMAKNVGNTMKGDYINASATMSASKQGDLSMGQSAQQAVSGMTFDEYLARVNEARMDRAEAKWAKADEAYDLAAQADMLAKWKKGDLAQIAIDVGEQVPAFLGDYAISAAAGALSGGALSGAGLATMAVRAYGGGAHQARQAGLSVAQQEAAGLKSALIEVATEKMFSGIDRFAYGKGFAGGVENAIDMAIEKAVKKPGLQKVFKYLANSGEEAIEEIVSGFANPLVDKVIGLTDSNGELLDSADLGDIMYDGLVGFLMGLSGGSVNVATNKARDLASTIKAGKIANATWTPEVMQFAIDSGLQAAEDSRAAKLAGKYNEKDSLSTMQKGRLAKAVNTELNRGTFAAGVQDALGTAEDTGMTAEDYGQLVTSLAKSLNNEELTATEENAVARYGKADEVKQKVIQNDVLGYAYANRANPAKQIESKALSRGSKTVSVDGESAGIKNVIVKDGKVSSVVVENGKGTQSVDVDKLPESAQRLVNASTQYGDYAGIFVANYHEGENLSSYARNFNTAFELFGKGGVAMDKALGSITAKALGEDRFRSIMEAGAEAQKTSKTPAKKSSVPFAKKGAGKVGFDDGTVGNMVIDEESLTARQKQSVKVVSKMAEVFGINFVFFQNKTAKNSEGEEVFVGSNGMFVSSTNTIYLDINAGRNKMADEVAILRTAAHELTHYIQKNSPEQYEELKQFVVGELIENQHLLGEDMTFEDLVKRKIENSASAKHKLTEAEAIDEVVADACEMMLKNSTAMQTLAQQKPGLANTIKKWLNTFKQQMRAVFKGIEEQHIEAKALKDSYDKLQAMWDKALVGAVENAEVSADIGINIDNATESANPDQFSERTWTESDYMQAKAQAAKELAAALGVSERTAKKFINDVNSIAKMIADDRVRLDYFSSPGRSAFVSNAEYGGSIDFSTLCKKRRLMTGTFSAIQNALPNTALTPNQILEIRNMMIAKGLEVNCGLCYVEGSRANMGVYAQKFLERYAKRNPEYMPTLAEVNTPDGIEKIRIQHPEVYEAYEKFWNNHGVLNEGESTLFASQQKPKLYQLRTEYKGEILKMFRNTGNVEQKNLFGGLRLQSFSDFEIAHLIDTMQVVMDMSRVGLAGQAYTKVPEFAWVFGNTGMKINLSLIAKDVDENGNLVFDNREGMNFDEAMRIRDAYSDNVGTILVVFNDAQLKAALKDDRIDFVIPFHRSQWKKSQYAAMGLPANTKDYTNQQNEKYIKPVYYETRRGTIGKRKATNYMPNEYWDFSKSGKENAEAYLEMCARDNKRPKFYKLLVDNKDGSYSLQPDGSTDGYWKLLIDFKMYNNKGKGIPQTAVKPTFAMEKAVDILNNYQGGHSSFPVAYEVVDEFLAKYGEEAQSTEREVFDEGTQFSLREEAPPKKTQWGFKLMTVDENGLPHAMFIDNAMPYEIGKWYNADSPNMEDLMRLEPEYAYLVDADGNADIESRRPIQKKPSGGFKGLPGKAAINEATNAGKRWMVVSQYSDGKKSFHNVGINGSGAVSVYALRPGIHAVDIPSMKHIGAQNSETKRIDRRRPNQRWFLIEYPVDVDYNQEAYANESKDIQDHLPTDGWYSFQTNSGAEKRQHWFITGAMKIVGAVSEADVRAYTKSQGFEQDLAWKDGKAYDDAKGAIDLMKYVREHQDSKTPSKTEMRDRIEAGMAGAQFSDRDSEYMEAYFDGDDETMQRLVDEAAFEAGYKYKAYHHTENAFTVFDRNKARKNMDIQGFFFSADPDAESEYGSVRYDTYLKMENPYIIDSKAKAEAIPVKFGTDDYGVKVREWLQSHGYDSVIRKAEYYGAEADEYIVFEPTQIKSSEPITYADDENGEGDPIPLSERFNPNNPDIRYSTRDVGYHAGDLGKAEFLNQQGIDRGTGHFGTGTYFVGEEEKVTKDDHYGKRPQHAVSFSDYKLFKVRNDRQGYRLHDALRFIDGGVNWDWIAPASDMQFNIIDPTEHYDIAQEISPERFYEDSVILQSYERIADKYGLKFPTREEFIAENNGYDFGEDFEDYYADYVKESMDEQTREVNEKYRKFMSVYSDLEMLFNFDKGAINKALRKVATYQRETPRNARVDSYATVFMKAMGYEGVDVRGTGLDNTAYGSVIYDVRDDSVLYQERDTTESNRAVLADALSEAAQNENERGLVRQYKKNLADIEKAAGELSAVQAELSDKRKAKAPRDEIVALENKAKVLAGKVDKADGKLLKLTAMEPMQAMIQRTKDTERKQAAERRTAAVAKAREVERAQKQKELARVREQKSEALRKQRAKDLAQKNKETAELRKDRDDKLQALKDEQKAKEAAKREQKSKTKLRSDIKKHIRELNKLFRNGKEKNVKYGMRDWVSTAIATADILFSVDQSNEEIIRNGIGTELSDAEQKLVTKLYDNLAMIDEMQAKVLALGNSTNPDLVGKQIIPYEDAILKLRKENGTLMSQLKDVFARERNRINRTTMDAVIDELATGYRRLKDSSDAFIAQAYNENVATRFDALKDSVGGTLIKDMSIAQLEEFDDALAMVIHTIKTADKLFRNGKLESAAEKGQSTIAELESLKRKPKETRLAQTEWLKTFSWENEKPVFFFDRVGSDTLTEMYNDLVKGEDVYARDIADARTFISDIRKRTGFEKWDFKKTYSVELESGQTIKLNLQQLMSIYAYSKREQAAEHMRVGGFRFAETETTGKALKRKDNSKTSYRLSIADQAKILGLLTAEQKQYATKMQDYLSTVMGAKGNEASRILYGVDLFKENFYFPLKSDSDFRFEASQVAGEISLKNAGMTKETVPHANNPIVLQGFDTVWANHVNKMSTYHSLVVPIDNFLKVYNYSDFRNEDAEPISVKTVLDATYSTTEVTTYISNLLKDLNGGVSTYGPKALTARLVSKFKKTAVAASASVIVQQPTAVLRAMAMINPKYFVTGALSEAAVRKSYEQIKRYAPVAIIKEIGGFDVGSGMQSAQYLLARDYEGAGKFKGFATDEQYRDDILMSGAGKADEMGWSIIWGAVKREVKATTNLKPGSDEFLAKCGERFSEVIRRTQVYDSVFSRSGYMRSQGDIMKMATAFMGEPTTTVGLIENAVLMALRKKTSWGNAIGTVLAAGSSVFAATLAKSLIYAARDDDDDEAYWNKYFETVGKYAVGDLMLTNMLPFVKDIMSIKDGWSIERSDMAIINDILSAYKSLTNVDKSLYRRLEDFLGAIAALGGVPLKNIMRDARSAYNVFKAATDDIVPSDVWDSLVAGYKGESPTKAEKLQKAILNGETERVAIILSSYADEEKAANAYRSAVKANFLNGSMTEAEAQQFLLEVNTADEAADKIANWSCERDLGIKFSELKQTYVDEGLNATQAIDALVKYGGKTETEAEERVLEWTCELETGIAYEDIASEYRNGNISSAEAISMWEEYGGKDEDYGRDKIAVIDFKKQYPEVGDISASLIGKYTTYVEGTGVSPSQFLDIRNRMDANGNGSISQDEAQAVLDSSGLNSSQKSAIWKSINSGWKKNPYA